MKQSYIVTVEVDGKQTPIQVKALDADDALTHIFPFTKEQVVSAVPGKI